MVKETYYNGKRGLSPWKRERERERERGPQAEQGAIVKEAYSNRRGLLHY
jgi:hypothetical protein